MSPTPDEKAERATRPAESDLGPFYAVAGLADVIAETLRETLAERQRRAEERFAEIRDKRLVAQRLLIEPGDEQRPHAINKPWRPGSAPPPAGR